MIYFDIRIIADAGPMGKDSRARVAWQGGDEGKLGVEAELSLVGEFVLLPPCAFF